MLLLIQDPVIDALLPQHQPVVGNSECIVRLLCQLARFPGRGNYLKGSSAAYGSKIYESMARLRYWVPKIAQLGRNGQKDPGRIRVSGGAFAMDATRGLRVPVSSFTVYLMCLGGCRSLQRRLYRRRSRAKHSPEGCEF